jgi:hypothetical protein
MQRYSQQAVADAIVRVYQSVIERATKSPLAEPEQKATPLCVD